MVHDFAKSPRVGSVTGAAHQLTPPRTRKLPKGRWLLMFLVAGSLVYWRLYSVETVPDTDFVPGDTETREYQQALEQQEQERLAAARAEAVVKEAEQKRLTADLQAKLKSQSVSDPEFGFYETLPDSAWKVPVQQGVYVSEEERIKRANQRFMLQAASVRDAAEAQRIVQRLRQLGLQAFFSHDETGGWYRINVGPFDNVSKMNKAEDILVSLRMMPLKRKL